MTCLWPVMLIKQVSTLHTVLGNPDVCCHYFRTLHEPVHGVGWKSKHVVMSKKKLLITFDAFGTLFTPKEPIAKQYVDVARKHGLESLDPKRIGVSFKTGKLEIQMIEIPTHYIDRSVF